MLLTSLALILIGQTAPPPSQPPTEDLQVRLQKAFAVLDQIKQSLDRVQERLARLQRLPRNRIMEEVPSSHWAYDVCQQLQQCDLLLGYPDTYFWGQSLLIRWEFAVVTKRTLETLLSAANRSEYPGGLPSLTLSQLDILSKLFSEFLDELKQLGVNTRAVQQLLALRRLPYEVYPIWPISMAKPIRALNFSPASATSARSPASSPIA